MSDLKATVCVTFDHLGKAAQIRQGLASRPDPDEPGLRSLPAALAMLARLDITATFFVEGWNGLHHPEAIQLLLRNGHEVGLHGWIHEKWDTLTDAQRESCIFDGTAGLRLAGVEPIGFRAPGGYRGTRTAEVLLELGYTFDCSIDEATEDERLAVNVLPGGLLNIPFHWETVDWWQYYMHPDGPQSPAQVLDHFNSALDEAIATGGLITLIVHPFESFASKEKFAVVESFLTRAVASPDVDVLSAGQLAERVRLATQNL